MHKSKITNYHNTVVFPSMIGMRVWKNPKTEKTSQPRPFKSGLKVNTVKGLIMNPNPDPKLQYLVFTFVEDDTYVAAHICSLAPEGM